MILNVDDHEAGRYVKSRLLRQAGFEVAEAATGGQALELVASLRPWLVVLDVNLPDMSGLTVCRLIKTDKDLSTTPVLQISAAAISPQDRAGGLDNGADAYLVEPVDAVVLVATVRALLRMRKAEFDLEKANGALQAANAMLTRSNEDLQRFSYAASHDLREPLRTISCFAGLLEKKYRGRFDADADKMLASIQRGAARMNSLIEGLLIYAQAGESTREDWGNVDLARLLAGTLSSLEQSVKEARAVVEFEPLPTVTGNELLLSQLFQNLIHNALKYPAAEEPAHIRVSFQMAARNMVEIAIADKGLGIPPEHQRMIFAPFHRLHGSGVAGFGIGLATCQRIVEGHGGKIWVESEGVRKGSTFRFLLPLAG
jgi:signal transduction histidine kinase